MEDAALSQRILEGARHALVEGSAAEAPEQAPRLVVNDHRRGEKMLAAIESELARCSSFAFSVAFISDSGIRPLKQSLRELEQRGVPGRILTTDYLSFSDPSALEELAQFSNIEVRMYRTEGMPDQTGFHTKGYLFDHADGSQTIIVGSSNMTGSALSQNKEWNLEFTALPDGSLARSTSEEFEELWSVAAPLDCVLDVYRQSYEEKRRQLAATKVKPIEQIRLVPNAMQSAFVASLQDIIDRGERRALLISATGTGKTYAAAFAVQRFKPRRMLFLVHREQVLRKAKESFRRVLGPDKSYGLLSGNEHDYEADCLFATMQTMAKPQTLARFAPDAFDFIIIDEVHRAGSASYERILDHFRPRFCLGMTASPDRPDGFDIYALFDNNIAYEIRLQQAEEENLLCPFHYFGVTDITVDGRPIDDLSDFGYLVCDERVSHIMREAEFYGHCGDRVMGLIFCRSNREARELSKRLNERGWKTLALSGADGQEAREDAIARLTARPGDAAWSRRLDYILTVDIFNEGVDIPEVNQVIMLRPTQSPIVFVQQLGRGLRKDDEHDKDYVVVIDFIGNYENNFMIPIALSGDRSYNKDSIRRYVMEGDRVIPGCSTVHFDEVARERIFDSIDNSGVTVKLLKEQYELLKHKLGRVPGMVDFLHHGGIDPMLFVEHQKSYARFLSKHEKEDAPQLSESEHLVIEFLSRYCGNGMRPHELLALQALLEGETMTPELMEERLEYYAMPFSETDYRSAAHVLDKSFVNMPGDKRSYETVDVVRLDAEGDIAESESLQEMLGHEDFRAVLTDLVQFGLGRYEEKYAGSRGGLKLYEKYSRKDVCRLLNWEQDTSSTVYGYKVKGDSCPIFVTYEKSEDISATTQYADHFESRSVFSWMTRSRRTLESDEVRAISEADESGMAVHLFVKKSDGEGSDFYYLGRVHPRDGVQTTQPADDGSEVPIVNFKLQLEQPVDEAIYDYFTSEAGSGEALTA